MSPLEAQQPKYSENPGKYRWRRIAAPYAAGIPLPNEVHINGNSLERIDNLAGQGYGVLLLYTHLAEDDQLRLMSALYSRSSTLREMDAYTPIAYHVRKKANMIAHALGMQTREIVTEDTVAKGKNVTEEGQVLPLHYGEKEYVFEAKEALKNGEIVFVAPQGGRRRRLEKSNTRPVEMLLRRMDDEKIAILFVGLGFKDLSNYDRKDFSKINLGRKFIVNVGPTFTQEELKELAQDNSMTIDEFVLWQLGEIVPAPYNNLEAPSTDTTSHLQLDETV